MDNSNRTERYANGQRKNFTAQELAIVDMTKSLENILDMMMDGETVRAAVYLSRVNDRLAEERYKILYARADDE